MTGLKTWSKRRRATKYQRLTLRQLAKRPELYMRYMRRLNAMPLPAAIRIGRGWFPVPLTLKQFSGQLSYGQRLFLAQQEPHDIGYILRYMDGYYYTMVTGRAWNENDALSFGRKILNCKAKDVFPIVQQLIKLMEELVKREQKALYREPTKQEKAAGIERLNRFAHLTSMLLLQESFRMREAEVLQLPYDDCLVRFMLRKEQQAYQERLLELQRKESDHTHRHK
jgi:hypothetical protein